ncbi:MAG: anthranilate phosphoribosyltransferase [Blastocatellia bacterium]|nr:anthranilate phosphoribosyltransferase [Blastocatellia bacterium]
MLSPNEIHDLIHLRMPEGEVREVLGYLSPERVDEATLKALVTAMQATERPHLSLPAHVIDCCGTGGSGQHHFNVSTTVAFVLAAGGVPVAKFGNRAVTSRSGSFDLLGQLGIPTETPLGTLERVFEKTGLVFLFAPQFYPVLKPFHAVRRAIGTTSVFNFLGPLLHPLEPHYRLLGVSHQKMQRTIASYLTRHSRTKRAMVVRGEDGMDEITYRGKTIVYEVEGVRYQTCHVRNRFRGKLPEVSHQPTAEENLYIFQRMIQGKGQRSVYFWQVCQNAGAAFAVTEKTGSLQEGAAFARELLVSGKVRETVESYLKEVTNGREIAHKRGL